MIFEYSQECSPTALAYNGIENKSKKKNSRTRLNRIYVDSCIFDWWISLSDFLKRTRMQPFHSSFENNLIYSGFFEIQNIREDLVRGQSGQSSRNFISSNTHQTLLVYKYNVYNSSMLFFSSSFSADDSFNSVKILFNAKNESNIQCYDIIPHTVLAFLRNLSYILFQRWDVVRQKW